MNEEQISKFDQFSRVEFLGVVLVLEQLPLGLFSQNPLGILQVDHG